MPRHSILNDMQKDRVVELFDTKKVKQADIARYFAVSPRTINRVLIERGCVDSPEQKEANRSQILRVCEEFNLDAQSLRARLQAPELSLESIRHVLGNLDPSQLGVIIHSSIHQAIIARQQQARAMPTHQEKLAL